MIEVGQTARRAAVRPSFLRRRTHMLSAFFAVVAVLAAAGPAAAATEPPPAPRPQALSAIIIDRVTGRVLYGHDVHVERPMASTTKIMTALIVVQRAPDLSRSIRVPFAAAPLSGIGLEPGQRITIRNALLGLMVKSAQDCGVTLATAFAGSETAFVRLMNAKARKLGLRHTTYRNANGSFKDPGHHSSAYDLARLARHAMKDARFRDLAARQSATVYWSGGHRLAVRSNNLLLRWDWADGVKCGFTGAAGSCLVGSGQPGLRPLITATLGAPTRDDDVRDHVALFEWASALYETRTIVTAGDVVREVPLAGGGAVQVAAAATLTEVVRGAALVRATVTLPRVFSVRPRDGKVVGSVVYRADGVKVGTVKLVVAPQTPPETPAPEAEEAGVSPASSELGAATL
jgi:D-alanyl-D-alanine carboxypeptidase (penicillin-binding protein 5/6)